MPNETVKENLLWDPVYYKDHCKQQFNLALNTLKLYPFKGNEEVLDIGCGTGEVSAEIAKRTPHGSVVGFDYSNEMIASASKTFESVSNLSFAVLDATNFNLNKSFDLITSFNTFHWIEKQEAALKNIYKHLKPGGDLVINMSRPKQEYEVITEILYSIAAEQKWRPYFKDFKIPYYLTDISQQKYESLLLKTGFKVLSFHEKKYLFPFLNELELANWFKGWMIQRSVLPKQLRSEFFLEVAKMYIYIMQNIPISENADAAPITLGLNVLTKLKKWFNIFENKNNDSKDAKPTPSKEINYEYFTWEFRAKKT